MYFLRLLYGTAFSCVAWFSHAVEASDAHAALRAAVEADPRVLAGRSHLAARQVEADGAKSAYLPTVRGTGSSGSLKSSDPLTRDGSKKVYGLEIAQPIPLFGHESTRVELARETLRVEETEASRIEQAVLAEILEVTLEQGARRAMLDLREQQAAAMKQQTAAARDAVAGGGLKTTELAMIQSRAVQADALLAQAKADSIIAEAKARQRFPAGLPAARDADSLLRTWSIPASREAALDAASTAAPALLKAQAATGQARAEHAVARADLWPKLSLSMQWQRGRFGEASADSQGVFIGLSAPLYEGGSSSSKAESAALRARAAQESQSHEQRQLALRIDEAWARWLAAADMVQAWREAETQEREVLALTETQLASGAATRIVLLQVRQSLFETALKGIEYRWQQDVARVRLLHEAGLLTWPAEQSRAKD